MLGHLKTQVHLRDPMQQIFIHKDLYEYEIIKLKTNSQYKCPEKIVQKRLSRK